MRGKEDVANVGLKGRGGELLDPKGAMGLDQGKNKRGGIKPRVNSVGLKGGVGCVRPDGRGFVRGKGSC